MRVARIYGAELLSGNLVFGSGADYWAKKRREMETHPLVGKKARLTVPDTLIFRRICTVLRADDNIIVFDIGHNGEYIYSYRGDNAEINWL